MKKEITPISFETPIIETHCHVDMFEGEVERYLREAQLANVQKFIQAGVTVKTISNNLNLAHQFDELFISIGTHPEYADEVNDETLAIYRETASDKNVIAIGEIGLDYHYLVKPREVQISAFERQIELATSLNLPIMIHTRDAEDDTMSILKNFRSSIKVPVVLHSYTSNMLLAEYALGENFTLGFNGIVTFKNGDNVRDVLKITPLEQIILETDSPFLAPIPFRGNKNESKYLPWIAQKVSEVKEIEVETLLKQVYQNSIKIYNV